MIETQRLNRARNTINGRDIAQAKTKCVMLIHIATAGLNTTASVVPGEVSLAALDGVNNKLMPLFPFHHLMIY